MFGQLLAVTSPGRLLAQCPSPSRTYYLRLSLASRSEPCGLYICQISGSAPMPKSTEATVWAHLTTWRKCGDRLCRPARLGLRVCSRCVNTWRFQLSCRSFQAVDLHVRLELKRLLEASEPSSYAQVARESAVALSPLCPPAIVLAVASSQCLQHFEFCACFQICSVKKACGKCRILQRYTTG